MFQVHYNIFQYLQISETDKIFISCVVLKYYITELKKYPTYIIKYKEKKMLSFSFELVTCLLYCVLFT